MNQSKTNNSADKERRRLLQMLLAGSTTAAIIACSVTKAECTEVNEHQDKDLCNNLLWAVAWKQTSAEYFALCYQAYNLAKMRIDHSLHKKALQENTLAKRRTNNKPLAVIVDMDETVLHASSYWGHLVKNNKDFFNDAIWDEWIPKNLATAVPGAIDFLNYCQQQSVAVFYVTSRNQGTNTYQYALDQLKLLKFPYADKEHLYVFTESSDKTPAREKIAKSYQVVLLIGDNLNDYHRDYYVKDVDQRFALMEKNRDHWGTKFILLPNPTDGHWVRAIFGDSEPEPTEDNRRLLKAAAMRKAWDGH